MLFTQVNTRWESTSHKEHRELFMCVQGMLSRLYLTGLKQEYLRIQGWSWRDGSVLRKPATGQEWWLMSLIPALQKKQVGVCEFEDSQVYTVCSRLSKDPYGDLVFFFFLRKKKKLNPHSCSQLSLTPGLGDPKPSPDPHRHRLLLRCINHIKVRHCVKVLKIKKT